MQPFSRAQIPSGEGEGEGPRFLPRSGFLFFFLIKRQNAKREVFAEKTGALAVGKAKKGLGKREQADTTAFTRRRKRCFPSRAGMRAGEEASTLNSTAASI